MPSLFPAITMIIAASRSIVTISSEQPILTGSRPVRTQLFRDTWAAPKKM
jgi:hypothetical protein